MTAPSLTSRFQIVERPLALPGKCASCGSTDRQSVDFGFDVDDYGTVYLCIPCLTEVGTVIGLVPEQQVRDASLEAGQSVNEWLLARDLKVITNEQYNSLLAGLTSMSTALVPVVFNSVPNGDEPGGTNDRVSGSEAQGESEGDSEGSGQDSKPNRRRGPASISSDSGNGHLDLGI